MTASGVAEGPLRLFVAVPLPPDALEACRALVEGVREGPSGRGARWVRTDGLHLTLRFLGATAPDRVPAVTAAVREAAATVDRFGVRLAGAGAFPSLGRPRALWIGITAGVTELGVLAHGLERPLASLGWPPETRPFRAHLTVARSDAAPIAEGAAAARALAAAAERWSTAFEADRLVLFRSHLGRGPARYEALAEAPLGG